MPCAGSIYRTRTANVAPKWSMPDSYDREFTATMGICEPPRLSSSRARIEIVMQGTVVRKARELHAMRKRKPLMGEGRASGCGEIDLGEIL